MTLSEKQKDKARRWIRVTMVFIAILLLVFAVAIPFINNAIALGVEKDLKRMPLPEQTDLLESTSIAGKVIGNGNGMQYFGAVLIRSDLTPEELEMYYADHNCTVEPQIGADIRIVGNGKHLSFRHQGYDVGHYIVYRWGSAPAWLQDWLDTDLRGH